MLSTWLWLLLAFVPLLFLERWVHRHLQGLGLLILRDPDRALMVYSILMLPGVLLHEASHWITATLLLVRTGRFSLAPAPMPDGSLRLGFVETEATDFIRESLIGAAPLIFGAAAILLVGYPRLGVGPVGAALAAADPSALVEALRQMVGLPDFWLWLYLIFTIANSMLPSASDRRGWWRTAIVLAAVTAGLFYLGLGSAVLDALLGPLDAALRALASAFTLTVGLNLCLVPLIWLFEHGLARLLGMEVKYD
ncbi:MAG: hypothetical protein IT317_23495 [Anaerolineales bacterium]|nr:hypothetical protein [Anaerolineales bacterium]